MQLTRPSMQSPSITKAKFRLAGPEAAAALMLTTLDSGLKTADLRGVAALPCVAGLHARSCRQGTLEAQLQPLQTNSTGFDHLAAGLRANRSLSLRVANSCPKSLASQKNVSKCKNGRETNGSPDERLCLPAQARRRQVAHSRPHEILQSRCNAQSTPFLFCNLIAVLECCRPFIQAPYLDCILPKAFSLLRHLLGGCI